MNKHRWYQTMQLLLLAAITLAGMTLLLFSVSSKSNSELVAQVARHDMVAQVDPAEVFELTTFTPLAVTAYEADLKGTVEALSAGSVKVHFELRRGSSGPWQSITVPGDYIAGQQFLASTGTLVPNTTYYYRACGIAPQVSLEEVCSGIRSFTTLDGIVDAADTGVSIDTFSSPDEVADIDNDDALIIDTPIQDNGGGGSDPEVVAYVALDADDITDSSAVMRGRVEVENPTSSNYEPVFQLSEALNGLQAGAAVTYSVGSVEVDEVFDYDLEGLLSDHVYYYWVCADGDIPNSCSNIEIFETDPQNNIVNDELRISTLGESGVSDDSVTLRGRVTESPGSGAEVWFEFHEDEARLDDNEGYNVGLFGIYGIGDEFETVVLGLDPETEYYYRACGEEGGEIDCGGIQVFTTEAEGMTAATTAITATTTTGNQPTQIEGTNYYTVPVLQPLPGFAPELGEDAEAGLRLLVVLMVFLVVLFIIVFLIAPGSSSE